MSKKKHIDTDNISAKLQKLLSVGPLKRANLCAQLEISQPSFSRIISKLSENIIAAGKAQKKMYALKRNISDIGNSLSIYAIDENGKTSQFGKLTAIFQKGFYFEFADSKNGESHFFDDIPYFINDLRPNGFLGRLIPKTHPELSAPNDIKDWSANDSLRYLTKFGTDLIGNLVLGDAVLNQYLQKSLDGLAVVDIKKRTSRYPLLAKNIMLYGDPGSSAGGEQPKFPAITGPDKKHVLVKFSPKITSDIGRRRADLLISEHLSLKTLEKHGHPAATSSIIAANEQIFLETERFDRIGNKGRKGLISLGSLCSEFVGHKNNWTNIAKELLAQKRIDQNDYDCVRWRELFGNLIANTDMHSGNISFYFEPDRILEIAPAYDMLPMLYAPQNEQLMEREFTPPAPQAHNLDIWENALKAAKDFWGAVANETLISDSFRKIALFNIKKLNAMNSF